MLSRLIAQSIQETLDRGKNVLLLGPRQTGKTTLIENVIKPDLHYNFAKQQHRQQAESDLVRFEKVLTYAIAQYSQPPLVFIDEVQKVPRVMDIVQVLIDQKRAQFILTGSSARKLKAGSELNLLPGRVVQFTMPPMLISELTVAKALPELENMLLYGSLPNIIQQTNLDHQEQDLMSYVSTYLEEEIRAEALVRNVGHFSRFLQLAAGESGKQLNFLSLAQDIGISDTTIANYYQILEDCLIALRIDPLIKSSTKRRLIKSPKYHFFDLGIRRSCANEGTRLPSAILGQLFEQLIGNELVYLSQIRAPSAKIYYWRDSNGPEVDFVLEINQQYIPVEVKYTTAPKTKDVRHLLTFINEYSEAEQGYLICRTPEPYQFNDKITVLPWQQASKIMG